MRSNGVACGGVSWRGVQSHEVPYHHVRCRGVLWWLFGNVKRCRAVKCCRVLCDAVASKAVLWRAVVSCFMLCRRVICDVVAIDLGD